MNYDPHEGLDMLDKAQMDCFLISHSIVDIRSKLKSHIFKSLCTSRADIQ